MGNLRLPFGGQEPRSGKKLSSTSLLKCCFEDNLKSAKKSLDSYSSGSIASMASPDCRLMGMVTRSYTNEEYDQINMMNENSANLVDANGGGGGWNVGYLTSTPALSGRDSMSPITKSTQRMPKSMQESIMTPRSRKPVMLLAGMNGVDQQASAYAASQSSFSSLREEDEDDDITPDGCSMPPSSGGATTTTVAETSPTGMMGHGGLDEEGSSLTSTFRDYLLSRSVMTDSPADLSFSSHPDDFDSSADMEDLSESKMSESLLFCMNGNKPFEDESETTLVNIRKRHLNEAGTPNADADEGGFSMKKLVLPCGTELDETSL